MLQKIKSLFTRRPTSDQPTQPVTKGYRPMVRTWFQQPRDLPPFSFDTIYAMLLDPQVRLCLAMRQAPLNNVQLAYQKGYDSSSKPIWVHGVKSRNPAVGAWVQRQVETIWTNYLPEILKAQIWGWSGGEVTVRLSEHNLIEIDRLLPRHASDVLLLKDKGDRYGIRVKRITNCGEVDLPFPYCWFHSFNPDAGEDYGTPVLLGAYSPWADKWLDGAALDTRRLYMHKDAYGGMKIGFPEESVYIDGQNDPVAARDLAVQIAEQRAAGGTVTYPTTRDAMGNPKWEIHDATVSSNPAHILQFPKDLDDEIRIGMEIPDDVISSDGVGGWAGKRVSLAAFYSGLDSWVTQIFRDLRFTLEPLVMLNWGKALDFDICFKPLEQVAMEQQSGAGGFQSGQQPVQQLAAPGSPSLQIPSRLMSTVRIDEKDIDPNLFAEPIAEILQSIFGDDAEEMFEKAYSEPVKRMGTWKAIDHPRGPDGRFIEKNSPEAVAAAKDKIRTVLQGERTESALREISSHLSILTTKQLRDLQREYNIKAGGAKPSLVAKIAERLHGKPVESKKRDDATPKNPNNQDVYTVPVDSLKVDPKRFQYKVKGVDDTGVTAELKGVDKWNPELAGALLVWRDPETGQDFVVNGHHRHELATRLNAGQINVRYIQAESAQEARARGALANIAEGRGSAIDAAKYLRDSGKSIEHLKEAGISMTGKVAADAAILKDLADKPFQMVTEGRLDEDKAIAVARHLKDPELQQKLFKKLEDRESNDQREWTNREIETAARKMASAGSVTQTGFDLFGAFEEEQSTFDQEVELEAYVSRLLQQEANDYRAVANKRRAERVTDAGNVLAVDENAKRAEAAESAASNFDRLSRIRGSVSEAIQIQAALLASAKTKKERDAIKEQTLGAIRAALGVPKTGDRSLDSGMIWKGDKWERDRETAQFVEKATMRSAQRNWPEHRKSYLQNHGRLGKDGKLEGVILNTDDWRSQFPQYRGTNAHEVHEASAELNNRLYKEALKETKGKGNGRMLILAGGGGSGKGTATKNHFDVKKYPIVLDQASANYPKLEKKLDEAIAAGFTPQHVFVDRGVSGATSGVIERAMNALKRGEMPRTVPLSIAMEANIASRKATLELLKRRKDIDTSVIDNTSDKGQTRLIEDRNEAIKYLESRIEEEDRKLGEFKTSMEQDLANKLRTGEIPDDVAIGLMGQQWVEKTKGTGDGT
jgi:hypothetical protein